MRGARAAARVRATDAPGGEPTRAPETARRAGVVAAGVLLAAACGPANAGCGSDETRRCFGVLCPPGKVCGSAATPCVTPDACAEWEGTGPEARFRFRAAGATAVTVTLTELDADRDLLVLGAGPSGACDAVDRCLAVCATTGSESVTFDAAAGESYFLLADGHDGATSTFRLTVRCQ